MSKCVCCKKNEKVWTWQPFGPGEDTKVFTTPGWHYRGFAALPICDDCKRITEVGGVLMFRYKRQLYTFVYDGEPVKAVASLTQPQRRRDDH